MDLMTAAQARSYIDDQFALRVVNVAFEFSFDVADLATGVPIPGYTPRAQDVILYESAIVVDVPWDSSSSASADLFIGADAMSGLLAPGISAVDLASTPVDWGDAESNVANLGNNTFYNLYVKADADAVYLVASQDATRGGDPIVGASQGHATVHLMVIPAPKP